jgi:hypothetical protein
VKLKILVSRYVGGDTVLRLGHAEDSAVARFVPSATMPAEGEVVLIVGSLEMADRLVAFARLIGTEVEVDDTRVSTIKAPEDTNAATGRSLSSGEASMVTGIDTEPCRDPSDPRG